VPGELLAAFLAGLVSVVAPCVLPLVPGYLSALAAGEPGQLGGPVSPRRVLASSVPFIAGFTTVFVVLGAGAAAIGGVLSQSRRVEVAGLLLVVFGLAFAGLLPWPERLVAPGLVGRARSNGSSALLGAAFAVCAAPCVGAVLGSVLVLAAETGTVARGAVLLTAYSLGLGSAFLLAGLAFARAMGTFRWLRDRWNVIRIASGAVLVAFGLLLFFHREWWLYSGLGRLLDAVGLREF
jgi:cytochrome c-type biogenesis protein